MTPSIEQLLKQSGLPGPRGNLNLMYSFAKSADQNAVKACLACNHPSLSNCPEEFVVMCGVVGYAVLNSNNLKQTISDLRPYASHNSWRIREAVAMGLQEIAVGRLSDVMDELETWTSKQANDLEKRAVVAALCEPKLLKNKEEVARVLSILVELTATFEGFCNGKLTDTEKTLRQALGYGLSVAMVAHPELGKTYFEGLMLSSNKHIVWVVKENLKKNRLKVMDPNWLETMKGKMAL